MPKAKAKTKNIQTPSPHHYVYPKTTTLKNKYGIKDLKSFLEKCSHDTTQAMVNLREEPLPDHFDSTYLCHIHRQLFKNTFEWAGHLRHIPFTFSDGTIAAMPEMKRTGWENPFAIGDEVQEGLQTLEQTLVEKNNLRDLTREEFNSEAISLFNSLNQLHPFREGNGRTQRVFFEKLALAAGHQLDFSLVTKERMMLASVAVAEKNDLEPMRHLFEDISNPEKILLLKEFMGNMKALGRNVNDRPVVVAKEGEIYTGTYRGAGFESFAFNVKGAYIIGNKDHLPPEQLKTLKPGDKFTFTVPKAQDLENTLIPKEARAPLTKAEYAEMISQDACVHKCREQIQKCAKIVYGSSKALNTQIVELIKNPNLGQQLTKQIAEYPQSVAHLAGFDFLCFKTQARANAEECVETLCHTIENFAHAVKHAKQEITKEHQTEQKRCGQTVAIPSQNLQNLFTLPKKLQQETLQASPFLQKELCGFVKDVNERLSLNEQKAIKNNDHATVAKSLGVSERKAQEISEITKQASEMYQQSQIRTVNRSKVLTMAS
ncbi:BID domain-containing T4SS effector [Bartonella harrusi]|uniref:protein adenylyltransferase n=1 Tax=Bartonella harrusi TaxID=2961895 RepID=A0ABY5ET86_9HYPH|nr:BID domain-containing T4SS effector [Bartonella harrusi]UTO28071.1 BID domain-containing T4SS effector [Bartonella harrusi]